MQRIIPFFLFVVVSFSAQAQRVGINTPSPSQALDVVGYSRLAGPTVPTGATSPGIATAVFTATMPTTASIFTSVPLGGIAISRVLSVYTQASFGNGTIPAGWPTNSNYEYNYYMNSTSNTIELRFLTTASSPLYGAPVKLFVTYQP